MAQVVRMSFENGARPVKLLQQNYAGEFMGNCQLSQGKKHCGRFAHFFGKPICRTYDK